MIAIVLVGGKNNLVNSKNSDTPIGMTPIAGEPIVSWITKWLQHQGFKHIIFSAGSDASTIAVWANQISAQQEDLVIDVVAETRPLGTAGAAALCIRRFPCSSALIINGDSLLLTDLKPAINKLKNETTLDGIIMGTKIANAGRFGTLECDKQQRLIGFHEKQSGQGYVNAGVYLLRSHLLENIRSDKEISLEVDCFPDWVANGKHFIVSPSPKPFIDMGTAEALCHAEEQIRLYQSKITGEKKQHPPTFTEIC